MEGLAGRSRQEIRAIIHQTAAETGRSYNQVANVLAGRKASAGIERALERNLGMPLESMSQRVPVKCGECFITFKRTTECICMVCEARYTREIFWTGGFTPRIRCPQCNRSLGLRDYEEVIDD